MTPRRLAAVPDEPRRVVLYVRVSSLMGRGGEDFHSPDVQTGAMRRQTAGMREVEVIEDIDQSGRTFNREGIDRIRRLAEAHAIDALAVYNVSRLGRNVLESLKFLNWLAERGVTILSATEHIDTSTPAGRWMLTNMLAIAEMRSDEIGAEWSRTINHRASAGKHHGRVPTGYIRGDDGRLIPDPIVGLAVAQAFVLYADGAQVRGLRRSLQDATGLMLATSTVKKMLANISYRGVVHARSQVGIVEVADAHVPLVDEATWQRVQTRLARDRRVPARVVAPRYALSGLGRCGVCKGPANHRPYKGGRDVRIFCGRRWEALGGDRCTGCGMQDALSVEAAVLDRIRARIAELRADVGAQEAQLARGSRASIDAASVRDELGKTRKAIARATERWAREQMDDRTYDDTVRSLRDTESRLAVALSDLQEVADRPEPGTIVRLGEELLELWSDMVPEERNQALRDLIDRVELLPAARYRQPAAERIVVHWR